MLQRRQLESTEQGERESDSHHKQTSIGASGMRRESLDERAERSDKRKLEGSIKRKDGTKIEHIV